MAKYIGYLRISSAFTAVPPTSVSGDVAWYMKIEDIAFGVTLLRAQHSGLSSSLRKI